VLYNVIDPELPQKLTEASLENTREMMTSFGAPEESIDQAVEQARASTEKQFTLTGQLISLVSIFFFSAIMALISAILVKKNPPVEL